MNHQQSNQTPKLGVWSYRSLLQSAQDYAIAGLGRLVLGVFAVLVTPREEEPQINVTMANVLIPFPGASVKDVEQMVTKNCRVLEPNRQRRTRDVGPRPGLAIITAQFEVGVPRTEALVRLYDTVQPSRLVASEFRNVRTAHQAEGH